jgi:probable phosphoglycerate mutase
MQLYFARHGESECNLTRELSNTGVKHPLTAKGVQQAHALAARLAANQRDRSRVRKIYASPLLRAQQTARVLAEALGAPMETTGGLAEYSTGVLEGRSDPAAWGIYASVEAAWLEKQDWAARIEGGESVLDMSARFLPLIAEITRTHADDEGAVVLIGHGGLYRWMLPLVLPNLSHRFTASRGIPNTAYVLAEWMPDGWHCTEWCGEHLAAGAAA